MNATMKPRIDAFGKMYCRYGLHYVEPRRMVKGDMRPICTRCAADIAAKKAKTK